MGRNRRTRRDKMIAPNSSRSSNAAVAAAALVEVYFVLSTGGLQRATFALVHTREHAFRKIYRIDDARCSLEAVALFKRTNQLQAARLRFIGCIDSDDTRDAKCRPLCRRAKVMIEIRSFASSRFGRLASANETPCGA